MTDGKLLPCPVPWCGRQFPPNAIRWPVVANKTTQWAVHCDDCDLYGPVGETEVDAVRLWNEALATRLEQPSGMREAHAAMRWVYENGMKPDHSRPDWVSKAFDDAYAEVRESRAALSKENGRGQH